MKEIGRLPLSEFFRALKAPQYVLGTTYTVSLAFFESAVYPHIGTSKLKHCLILCDSLGYRRAMTEGPALLGVGQRYLMVPAPSSGSFHAKVWLVVDEQQLFLLVGSGNLTQSGFMQNVELFEVLHYSHEAPIPNPVLQELIIFLDGLRGLWPAPDHEHLYALTMLQAIRNHVAAFPTRPGNSNDPRFLSSFSGPLIEQLPDGDGKGRIHISAPYFGGGLEGIRHVRKRYPAAQLSVYPSIHQGGSIDLPLENGRKAIPDVQWYPLDLGDQQGCFAHAKLYGYESATENNWLFCTSANCTAAALTGENVEAGVLRWLPTDAVKSYFRQDHKTMLPSKSLSIAPGSQQCPTIPLWAVDLGHSMTLHLSQSAAAEAPLMNVQIALQAGSHVSRQPIAQLFQDSLIAQLPWSGFGQWSKPDGVAVMLRLEGVSAKGYSVEAVCFVENHSLLSADPLDRSAFRAAITLMEQGGLPLYTDLAAIFALTRLVFDERLPESMGNPTNTALPITELAVSEKLPLWPPQAIPHSLAIASHGNSMGHLQWCQRLLELFLRPPESNREVTAAVEESDGDIDADGPAPETTKVLDSVAKRMWGEAQDTFVTLMHRLERMNPTKQQAADVWPAAVFILLATLAVRRAIERLGLPTMNLASARPFISRFISQCFSYRGEGPRLSPSLAENLSNTHRVVLHPDLACVIGAALLTLSFGQDANDFLISAWLRLKRITGSDWGPTEVIERQCFRIWHQFMSENDEMHHERTFVEHWRKMWNIGWTAHSGCREYRALKALAEEEVPIPTEIAKSIRGDVAAFSERVRQGTASFQSVDPCLAVCVVRGCSRAYQLDSAKKCLSQWIPVICQGCGTVLVPQPLLEIENEDASISR